MHAFAKHLYFAVHNVHSLSCTVCMHVLLLGWITCRWGKACVWPHKWYVICACMHALYISATLQPLLYRVCTMHAFLDGSSPKKIHEMVQQFAKSLSRLSLDSRLTSEPWPHLQSLQPLHKTCSCRNNSTHPSTWHLDCICVASS